MINVDFADVRTVMSEMGQAMMGTGSATGDNRAREAAEMAIGSPLLEDVDLQGARGILVNVTAGLDLTLGEFTEVGQVIEEFASEHATVVIGTVIDHDLVDELKVTVVATGLGVKVSATEKPKKVVDNTSASESVRKAPTTVADYAELDKPAHTRNQAAKALSPRAESIKEKDMDYLDIPAFLRRQAD
jgi:cell division protein FtsZ